MKNISKFLKKQIKKISFLSIILLVIFVNTSSVFANYMGDNIKGNKKVQQLFEKIEMIHEAFPRQTDEAALYATLVHRGTLTDYLDESYDPDFDSEEYKDTWSKLAVDIDNLVSNIGQSITTLGDAVVSAGECIFGDTSGVDETSGCTDENATNYNPSAENDDGSCEYNNDFLTCVLDKTIEKYADRLSDTGDSTLENNIKKPQAVDLLVAATIVMLDSSGWTGTYSDENYKQALAGDGLVGNMFDKNDPLQNFASVAMNGVFCTVGTTVDMSLSWFNPGFTMDGNGFGIEENAMAGKLSRYYTMANICQHGFIGATYSHVKNPDLSTEEGKEQYQGKKDIVAEEIIDLAERFRSNNDNCLYAGTASSGDMVNWKQTDSRWSSLTLGDGGLTVGKAGCTSTSMAYLIAKSGTTLTVPSIDPGVFVKNVSYTDSNLVWDSWNTIAPNFTMHTQGASVNIDNAAEVLGEVLNTPYDGQYQQFIILYLSLGHWVAVDHVADGKVYVFDPSPAAEGEGIVELSKAYKGSSLKSYNAFHATDVPFGSTGSSSPSVTGGDNCGDGVTSGNIIIPEEYGGGGYTVTVYNDFNWSYNQGDVYDLWAAAGAQWDDGIAVLDGRYLIACTKKFGNVGDKVDFFLDDGTKIPAIIADIKNESDSGANEWGHNNGQNVLEFEVSHVAFYSTYNGSNPGTNGWHMEWSGKRVSSATNLGESVL